jgi:hypothetical protein
MDENKNLENRNENQELTHESANENTTQPTNDAINTNQPENNNTAQETEKKKTAADIILEKLQKQREEKNGDKQKVEELRKLEEEVKTTAQPDTEEEKDDEEHTKQQENNENEEKIPNYNEFSREQLTDELEKLLEKPVENIKEQAELIKNTFYRKRNAEIIEKREEFVANGGKKEDFKVDPDEIDEKFKELFDKYKDLKRQHNEKIEAEKQRNLEKKYEIIGKIEELIEKGETLNKTFDEFQKLREEWKNTGTVPQTDAKNLLEKYNFTLQKFYDWVNINKELKELDLKKNLEQKLKLCEEAEALIIEPKVTRAYKQLQKLHEKWKEIGPVPHEHKDEIWERFKEASAIINRKHYNYFQEIKQQQIDNLKAKELLCEEAEKIADGNYEKASEWQNKTDEINELMKLWKLIGFAPKKHNEQIFERFISARKKFFDRKHEFFQAYIEILEKNLQEKEQLLIEAENAKNSTDWRKTTKLFVELQNRWKQIGPVPKAKKDEIWKKFNQACNFFFEQKREFFKNRTAIEEENLKLKTELIEKIKNFEPLDSPEENLKQLQAFQKQWSEIGHVPFDQKDKLYSEYKKAIDEKMKSLEITPENRNRFEQKNLVKNLLNAANPKDKIRREIEKVKNKIAKIHDELITLENNLTFFVKSKNAEDILNNFKNKIEKLKERKEKYEAEKLELIKALKSLDKKNKESEKTDNQ